MHDETPEAKHDASNRDKRQPSATAQAKCLLATKPEAGAQGTLVLADFAAAILAEREAAERLRFVRAHLATLVKRAVAGGTRYDELARVSIRTRTGRSATLAERHREIDRLRHVALRHPMSACHGEHSREFENAPSSRAGSLWKENDTMEKLLKRTTIEETFAVEDTDRELAAANREDDPREEDDESDEDDGKPSRGTRARR